MSFNNNENDEFITASTVTTTTRLDNEKDDHFTKFHSDILFHIISYCNIRDSGRFGVTNRRHYYIVHQYRLRRGPEFVASISNLSFSCNNAKTTTTGNKKTKMISQQQLLPAEVCYDAITKIQTIPNIAFGFCKQASSLPYALPSFVPNETVILCAKTKNIQSSGVLLSNVGSNSDGLGMSSSNNDGDDDDDDDTSNDNEATKGSTKHSTVECMSHSSVFLASMPNAKVITFANYSEELLGNGQRSQQKATKQCAYQLSQHLSELQKKENSDDPYYYKMFIIYACGEVGSTEANMYVKTLQQQYPKAIIVGGICLEAYVSVPNIHDISDPQSMECTPKQLMRKHSTQELIYMYQTLGGAYQEINKEQLLGNINQTYYTKAELAEHVYTLLCTKMYKLVTIDDGICGIALGGNDVPIHSIVSRGVVSRTAAFYKHHKGSSQDQRASSSSKTEFIPPPSQTTLYVKEADYVRYGDPDYMFNDDEEDIHHHPPYHIIRKIIDTDTNRIYAPSQLHEKFGESDLLGIRKITSSPNESTVRYENGFTLETPHELSKQLDAYVIVGDDEYDDSNNENSSNHRRMDDSCDDFRIKSLVGANIDYYDLDGPACVYDMDDAMVCLKEQTKSSTILGGIMFSCNGRGPKSSSMMPLDMADATIFEKYFPKIMCVGMYAYGEIGPIALAGTIRRQDQQQQQQQQQSSLSSRHHFNNESKVKDIVGNPPPYQQYTVFNQGNSCLQAFTAVFSLFIVPKNEFHKELLDDSVECIETFIQKQLNLASSSNQQEKTNATVSLTTNQNHGDPSSQPKRSRL